MDGHHKSRNWQNQVNLHTVTCLFLIMIMMMINDAMYVFVSQMWLAVFSRFFRVPEIWLFSSFQTLSIFKRFCQTLFLLKVGWKVESMSVFWSQTPKPGDEEEEDDIEENDDDGVTRWTSST